MNEFTDLLDTYLGFRRAHGYGLARAEKLLQQFGSWLDDQPSTDGLFTQAQALTWAGLPGGSPTWQHHRLGEGNSAVSHGRWQAWRLWVNRGNPGYRLHYWRDNDEFCFMNVRFHGDLSIDAPPEV